MREWVSNPLPLRWSSADQPPFVGRQAESAVLEAGWVDAVSGLSRAVFVGGPPGIGKSRLVSEVCVRLHEQGAPVYVGACLPEFGAPYEAFLEPLRGLLPPVREALADAGRAESVEILEALTGRTDAPPSSAGQVRLYDSVVDVVRIAAEINPFVLVLEDLQWADTATVRLLARLIEATTSSPWLLIGTARSTLPDVSDELSDAIARLSRLEGMRRIDLHAFEEDEIVAYLGRRTGMDVDAAALPARMLRELTGGNPFLLRETWAHVLAAVRSGASRVDMPETVHDLLRARITALDPAGRAVLQYAAVLGQEVDIGELVAMCDTTRDETLDQVDGAVRSGLLEPPRFAGDGYRFPHAIGRQAVIDRLPATLVTRMHAKVAVVLDEQFPAAPRIVQRLAHHYESARVLGYRQKATDHLEQAALQAQERLAFEEAARLFERAADCATGAIERDEFLLRATRCWTGTADFARARELSERVATEGTPEQRAEAAIRYAEACYRPGLSGVHAAELLRAASVALPADCDPSLRIRCLASLGRATVHSGNTAQGEALLGQAIADARDLAEPAVLADALRSSVTSTMSPKTLERSRARALEAMTLAPDADDDVIGASAHFRGTASYIVGDPDGIRTAELTLLEISHRLGAYWHYWVSCMHLARRLGSGRLTDVEAALRQVRRDEREFKSDIAPGASALQIYMVRRESGTLDRISGLLTGDEPFDHHWVPGLLALYTELGMADPARRALAWLLDRPVTGGFDSADWQAQLAFLAEGAIWLEDRDAASVIRPWLADYAGLNLVAGHFIATFGSADRYIGQLDSLCGVGEPEGTLQAALEMDHRMGAHLHVALTWIALAAHRRRVGAPDAAVREATESARAIAEPAGLERVLRLLRAQTGTTRTPGPDGLTAREIEVIRLLADGLSNRDVAARLVISEHTAANHVRSILLKTNAENRTQAAIYAREHRLA